MASKYPVISITLLFASGIFISSYIQPFLTFIIVLLAIAGILSGLFYWHAQKSLKQYPYFSLAAYFFSFSLGMLLHTLHYAPAQSNHYSRVIIPTTMFVVKGTIAERLKPNEFSEKYYFEVNSVDKKLASGKILLTVPKDSSNNLLHAGDQLIIADYLKPITKSLNPYQFDYAAYMAKQNVFHQLQLKKGNYIKAGIVKNSDYYIGQLRDALINSFNRHHYPPEVSNIIKALLLGQRQDMDAQTNENYTNAGVVHILAISGLHITILFALLNFFFRPLNRFTKGGKLTGLIIILGFLWVFALLSGLSASVVRSVVMFSFVSVGLYFNRQSDIYNSIAVSILVLLVARPNFLFDVGFQLSYAAVIAIVALQPLYKSAFTFKHKAVSYLMDTAAISLVAQVGVLPLSLYYFNQFPLLFLLANVVVIPLSTAVLVLGLVVLLLNFLWRWAAIWAGYVLKWLIILMNDFIAWIASFDKLVLKDIPFSLQLTIALYAVIVVLGIWLARRSYKRTAVLLCTILLFQGLYSYTKWNAGNSSELIIFHNRNASLMAIKTKNRLKVMSNDSLAGRSKAVTSYNKANFNQPIAMLPLNNTVWYHKHKILIVDSLGIYKLTARPDVVVLTQSPRVNLDRLIKELHPKQIVADATNYKTAITRWAATCRRHKIPFHATADNGFYRLQ